MTTSGPCPLISGCPPGFQPWTCKSPRQAKLSPGKPSYMLVYTQLTGSLICQHSGAQWSLHSVIF